MLKLNSVSFSYGEREIFHDLTYSFSSRRYALVGGNGMGKSTLARILIGELQADSGSVQSTEEIFYLSQREERDESDKHLSGGEWMRKRFSQAFASTASFVILDEPTNDLDQEGREMVKSFIRQHSGGLLLISHDRELLREVEITLELSNLGLRVYGGNYDFYAEQSQADIERTLRKLDEAKKNQKKTQADAQKKVERQERHQNRGEKRGAEGGLPRILKGTLRSRAEVSVGKVKQAKRQALSEAEEHYLEQLQNQKLEFFQNFDFESVAPHSGQVHAVAEDLNLITEHGRLWSSPLSFHLRGAERWRISGQNGVGKSTLLRAIAGLGWPTSFEPEGRLSSHPERCVLLDQDQSLLFEETQSLVEHFSENARWSDSEIRNQLALFGLRGEITLRPIRSLSGGERLKAALALIFLNENIPSLLLLDEPTNNLDLQSIKILEEALNSYRGSLLFVSHDEDFVKALRINNSLELKPGSPENLKND